MTSSPCCGTFGSAAMSSNSPSLTPRLKACHSSGVKYSAAPPGLGRVSQDDHARGVFMLHRHARAVDEEYFQRSGYLVHTFPASMDQVSVVTVTLTQACWSAGIGLPSAS